MSRRKQEKGHHPQITQITRIRKWYGTKGHIRSLVISRRERAESNMPKLREIDINYDQIRDLVYQLAFEKKMALIKEIVKDRRYQEDFYRFTGSLAKKYDIPDMNESELDAFLHE